MKLGSALGDNTQGLSADCFQFWLMGSTHQPGNRITPRGRNTRPVLSSRSRESHAAPARACLIGSRFGTCPAAKSEPLTRVMRASVAAGFIQVLVSIT